LGSKVSRSRRGTKPHERRADLHGEPSTRSHLEAPRANAAGDRRCKGRGRRSCHREVVRSGPEEGWVLPSRLIHLHSCWWRGLTRARGLRSSGSRGEVSGLARRLRRSLVLAARRGSRLRGRRDELWRGKRPGEHRPWRRGNSSSRERTRQREESSEVGEAGGTWRFRHLRSRATGKRVFGLVKRGPIAGGGNQATASSGVGVGETAGNKVEGGASLHAGG